MIVTRDLSFNKVSWLKFYPESVDVNFFYEPETTDELRDLCKDLYRRGKTFELIGHATNIYFVPGYKVDVLISTRKLKKYTIKDSEVVCECGVNVSRLSSCMVELGYLGFEGLINLPGTVGAAVYGNSSCYNCSVNSLLSSFTLLAPDGSIHILDLEWLNATHRSTCLKRNEYKGVILEVTLKLIPSDVNVIKKKSIDNQNDRRTTQPAAKNNLGSIFVSSSRLTLKGFIIKSIVKIWEILLSFVFNDGLNISNKKKTLELKLLNALEIEKYLHSWNRYMWIDSDAHRMFSKYVKCHNSIFRDREFEIEIKGEL